MAGSNPDPIVTKILDQDAGSPSPVSLSASSGETISPNTKLPTLAGVKGRSMIKTSRALIGNSCIDPGRGSGDTVRPPCLAQPLKSKSGPFAPVKEITVPSLHFMPQLSVSSPVRQFLNLVASHAKAGLAVSATTADTKVSTTKVRMVFISLAQLVVNMISSPLRR